MIPVFADTFYYLAALNRNDAAHDLAMQLSRELCPRIVTTAWVLTEVADALCSPRQRHGFRSFFDDLRADEHTHVIPPTAELFERGIELYLDRPDKHWSLTDCISFVVMADHGLTDALTGDQHFVQAGFKALLS